MSDEMLSAMDEIYANANRLVTGVGADQWSAATPCADWDVRALVNHMTGTSKVLLGAATRTAPTAGPDDDHLGDDPAAAFAAASAATAAAWRGDGAIDGMTSVPAEMPAVAALGVTIIDTGTHCWDLATATGQDHGLSAGTIRVIDEWNHNVVSDQVRSGGGFGEILDPSSDDALTAMLAFVGRTG